MVATPPPSPAARIAAAAGLLLAASATLAHGQAYAPAPVPAPAAYATPSVRLGVPSTRWYGGIEYFYWSVKDAPLSIPLISSGPEANKEGFLINSNSTILYGAPFAPASGGSDHQRFPGFSGSRLTLGYWLDDAQTTALEASAFALQRQTTTFKAQGDSGGSPGIRIPMFNTIPYNPGGGCDPDTGLCLVPRTEDGTPVSIPGDLTGRATARNSLQLWGADFSGVRRLYTSPSWEISGLAGLRFLELSEGFGLTDTLIGLPGSIYEGQSGTNNDSFKTSNQFYGAGLGLRTRYTYGPLSAELTTRIALGLSHEVLSVKGAYVDYGTNFAATSGPYGNFAMPANEGRFSSNKFAVVPEVQFKIGYDITPAIRVTIGYDFLYDSNVVRPGDQINRNVPKGQTFQQDGTQPSTTSPARLFRTTDFYAHGLNVGVTFRF